MVAAGRLTSKRSWLVPLAEDGMSQLRARNANTQGFWLWVVPLLFLTGVIAIPRLNNEAFYIDEGASLFSAGALGSGTWSLTRVLEETAEHSSEQALGWPLLLSLWGRFVGWSEVAVRTLPLLAGLLTIALLYRCTSDMWSPSAGLIAAALLAGSTLFLVYIAVARTFTFVLLFATLTIWGYWRVAMRSGTPGPRAQAGLFTGVLGLLFSHYFGALLIPALGIHYLFFARKIRQHGISALLLALALLLASLQLPVFALGFQRTPGNTVLQGNALATHELPVLVLYHLGNGLFRPGPVASAILLLGIPLAIICRTVWKRSPWRRNSVLWLLFIAAFALLAMMLLLNLRFQVMPANRIRYLMPLWALAAMAGGILLSRLAPGLPRLVLPCLLALWLAGGVQNSKLTAYRLEMDSLVPSTIHHVWRTLDRHTLAGDLLVADLEALNRDPARLYDRWLSWPHRILDRGLAQPLSGIREIHHRFPWLWLLFHERNRAGVQGSIAGLGRVYCDTVYSDGNFVLERYTVGGLACPNEPDLLAFEDGFTLASPTVTLDDAVLTVDLLLRSDDAHALSHFSVTLQLIDVASLERVARVDLGIGRGSAVPLHADIAVSQLPPGEYALRLALYNWETGERSVGRDLKLGHVSDIHTLQHIVLD